MAQFITRSGWIRILAVVVIGFAILPFTPGYKQQRNMRLAEIHANTLRPTLLADHRFLHVKLGLYTGAGGSLWVSGLVSNDADRDVLKELVGASRPPVKVIFFLQTVDEVKPSLKPLDK